MLGVMRETLDREGGSMSGEDDFFSVARTMPFVAKIYSLAKIMQTVAGTTVPFMPNDVTPWLTALRAYSVDPVSSGQESRAASRSTYLDQLATIYESVLVFQGHPGGHKNLPRRESREGEGISVRHVGVVGRDAAKTTGDVFRKDALASRVAG
jgi:hypothetical protein